MTPMSNKRLAIAFGACAAVAGLFGLASWGWQRRLPSEVQTLQAVVERLSRANALGRQPIAFMVGSGSYAARLAEQRGLCKPGQCDLFAQLNPYQHYGNGWDELMRQSYALGDIEAWSTSSGTVVVPRAAFRAYGPRNSYLACTVAHEIAHFRRDHIFKSSVQEHHAFRELGKKQKELASLRLSREQELEADRDAADMLARAGYQGRVCQQELEFLHRSVGDGSATEPESSHPGYEERLKAMKAQYARIETSPPKAQRPTPGSFRYDSADNLLTFSPALR
jgi:Zn-dependent protease with chaperone function